MKAGNIVGNRYGQVLVLKIADKQTCKNMRYTCLCNCGKIFDIQGTELRNGIKTSCGHCDNSELSDDELFRIATEYVKEHPPIKEYRYKHMDINIDPTKRRIHNIWKGMIKRCKSTSDVSYKYYGGRGISVCDEWKSFDVFYQWAITNGYRDDLSIDRIDYNGNYEPNNCRWADKYTQARNRRKDMSKLRSVVQLDLDGNYLATHLGVRIAQRCIGAKNHYGIMACCKGKKSEAHGYKWIYADEYEKIMEGKSNGLS